MISISRMREELGLPPTQDPEVKRLRNMVIALWEETTKRPWNAETGRVEFITPRVDTMHTVLLDLVPATSITQVRVRSHGKSTTWSILDTDTYLLIGGRRLRRLDAFWPDFVEVTYDGGVSEADEDIQQALALQARFIKERVGNEKLITKSQNFEGGGGVFEEAFLHPTFKSLAELKKRKS